MENLTVGNELERLRKYRRDLHKIPELDKELPLTLDYIVDKLKKLNCKLIYPATSSVAAYFDFSKAETVAYRADMDALPIEEKNTHEYKSTNKGKMHACGHDGHMAILLVFAEYLDQIEEKPENNVMLIFQPAEESTGGAKAICDSGVFEEYKIKRTYGTHLWPDLSVGTIGARPGPMMARASFITVEVEGLSSHVARADKGKDAMVAGARFLLDAYDMEAKEVPAEKYRLLKFGKLTSGTVGNAISAGTFMVGTLRAFDMETFNFMAKRLNEIANEISKETGCKFTIKIGEGYPALLNDESLFNLIIDKYEDEVTVLEEPSMTGEDFSFYAEKGPIFFFFLGIGTKIPLHGDTFDFDEKALSYGLDFYKKLLELK